MRFEGRVWSVGDNINTDLILPIQAFYLAAEEQARHVFSANRPGWAAQVRAGDILIGGRNFGMGSSRPAARSLKNLGLACLVAESINGLFFRNCVNFAFPAIACAGVSAAFAEGDTAAVDLDAATVGNVARGTVLAATPVPDKLRALICAGGVFALLEREGLIAAASKA
ncbi:MAG: 3-isopropylmalate dehydratase [Proteobacteria bacterium]|nr:3-isopropylmalate dehydratase [Burkholderiales bacterium]